MRLNRLALPLLLWLTLVSAGEDKPPPAEKTVHVTFKAGEKYHKAGCRHLKDRETKALSVSEAKKQGYAACKTCKPGE